MSIAKALLLLLVAGLVAFDFITLRGKNRRGLLLEVAVFVAGAVFIVFPERATALAHVVGIGRGVDFLLYPTVIWLVRESLSSRRQRIESAEQLTQLVRAVAILQAREVGAPPHPQSDGASPQVVESSASVTA
ncbi:MAG TPA: DUF2304 domain-containing protein [Polyangiaceae bacterium]|nr:DUF2304 domain-containing protein [Polyangiaceae bacterium]